MIHIPDISKGCTSAAQWKLHTGKKRWRCDGVLQRMHTSCTMKKFNTKRVKIWSRINGNIVRRWRQATQDPGPKNTKPGKGLLQTCAWKIVHWAALNLQRVNHTEIAPFSSSTLPSTYMKYFLATPTHQTLKLPVPTTAQSGDEAKQIITIKLAVLNWSGPLFGPKGFPRILYTLGHGGWCMVNLLSKKLPTK